MVNFKGKDSEQFWEALNAAGHWAHEIDGVWQYSDEAAIQAFVDAYELPMPILTPRQFRRMMATVGLTPLIREAFNILEAENNPMYADAYSQYYGGLEFYWDKSFAMYQAFYPMFVQIHQQKYGSNIPFTLDENSLRGAWWMARAT